ncbi:MAG: prolyl oligopeptidase family serine peptidase [Phycisphaeraceae bacterium]|nr:prolyl oligopeptidase family serine peptidase [Phycisphaeraceae bacterium]
MHDAPALVSAFPIALRTQSRLARAGEIPLLLAHPDWKSPVPTVLWMHGRTAYKELDPGRYLRWVRAGLAVCAIDLPGHGERLIPEFHTPARTLDMLRQAVGEVDQVVEYLSDPAHAEVFDLNRLAIGGMSAGGMTTLRRLCDEHPFRCAAVEGTTGNLAGLYLAPPGRSDGSPPWPVSHDPGRVATLDPMQNLAGFTPLPLLALHSEQDRLVPVSIQRRFIETLRGHYVSRGADPSQIEFTTWPSTGAPDEHVGFGRVSNEAKNIQAEFLARQLRVNS